MAAKDPNISVLNYIEPGGALTHIGGTLELGNGVSITVNAAGQPVWSGIPTADPHVVGVMWANAGNLTLSAG